MGKGGKRGLTFPRLWVGWVAGGPLPPADPSSTANTEKNRKLYLKKTQLGIRDKSQRVQFSRVPDACVRLPTKQVGKNQ
jgi:hypothetical protein